MVRLSNIEFDGEVICCDIFPEDSKVCGRLEVNTASNEIIEYSLPCGYEWCRSHIGHARDFLLSLSKNGEAIPKEKTIMWY